MYYYNYYNIIKTMTELERQLLIERVQKHCIGNDVEFDCARCLSIASHTITGVNSYGAILQCPCCKNEDLLMLEFFIDV